MSNGNSAIFIMTRSSSAWSGAEAMWITVAGWSAAARRLFGNAWVVTSDRTAQPDEVIDYPLREPNTQQTGGSSLLKYAPLLLKTMTKDLLLWKRTRAFEKKELTGPWSNNTVQFVWQQHDLFPGPGRRIANKLGVPLLTYVHAPVVWESQKWGVKRPFYGKLLEKFSERRSLQKSDLVLCVSEEVAKKVKSMGVDADKVLVSPMAVDPWLFTACNSTELKRALGLSGKFVIGWTGSFRSFHGLDHLVKAFKNTYREFPDSRLLLVGDGFEFENIKMLVSNEGLDDAVIFVGKQPFRKIPAYVCSFDIAVVSARTQEGFHYSPLKLREYLAAGKATIAPSAGEIPFLFQDRKNVLLYKTGDVADLHNKIQTIVNNPGLKKTMETNAVQRISESGTWEHELKKVLQVLQLKVGNEIY